MKTLYLDCGMGAAGDMLTGALVGLLPDSEKAAFIEKLNSLGIPGVEISDETVSKCGIIGTHISVKINGCEEDEYFSREHSHEHEHRHTHEHEHEHGHTHEHEHEHDHGHTLEQEHEHEHEHEHGHFHHHTGMHEIEHIVEDLPVSDKVRHDILAVYSLIAEAESAAHGVPVNQVHFHEVGSMDAVADITAVCMLIDLLGIEKIIASPVHVGCGYVECAHGILPVPAPATAYILRGVPIYAGEIKGELCTPTGAALLKYFVQDFVRMPVMETERIGYGMGKKDFSPYANCIRAFLGETKAAGDTITELSCNIDDMTPEALGFATRILLDSGAKDVFTVPIVMKKSRLGTLLCVICANEDREKMVKLIFKHTSTIGIREAIKTRYTLERRIESVPTRFGEIHIKKADGCGVRREKYEYDDLARIAEEQGLSLSEVCSFIEKVNDN